MFIFVGRQDDRYIRSKKDFRGVQGNVQKSTLNNYAAFRFVFCN